MERMVLVLLIKVLTATAPSGSVASAAHIRDA